MIKNGTILGDRYEIIEAIGSGGMADVYKAKCHKLNRYVAIKVLRHEYAQDQNFVSKFRAEAQAAAGLMHPNIVNVYDVGEEDGLYYFVMELVEGITLKHYIEKKIRLTVKEAVSIAIQVSMGIEAAHNNGIIHRDIKPQNIMISREGKVKVADFGIAKAVSSDTITSHAMGSVHYTSPEQARGGYSDAKSDIYSIGITLFEMVTGHVPFDGETTVAIAIKHIQTEMPSPRIYVPDIAVSVEKIILKCCQKNADRRYSQISELIADLKHSLMNPDEDFVVINDPASSEGTKTITDEDRSRIRQQTVVNGKSYNDLIPSFDNQEGRRNISQVSGNDDYYDVKRNNHQNGYENHYEDSYGNSYENSYDNSYNDPYGDSYEDPYEDPFEDYDGFNRYDDPYQRHNKRSNSNIDNRKSSNKSSNKSTGKSSNKTADKKKKNRFENENYYGDDELIDDVDPKMEKTVTILMIVVAIVITIAAVLIIGKVFGAFSSGKDDISITTSNEGIAVPNVVGKTVEEATEILKSAGLTAKATKSESTEYEKNHIMSQDLEPGTTVNPGTVLNLVVSSGKVVGVSVPDVVGKTEAEAKVILEQEGFVMRKQLLESASVEKGCVISQSPLGAESAPSGSEITVTISSGAGSSNEVEVPDLVGKDEATAKSLLEAAGLTCSKVSEEYNDSVAEGLVLNQSYAAATMAPLGTGVEITVSLGPEKKSYVCNVTVNAPGTYAEGSEAIIILMGNGGTEINRYTTTSFPYNLLERGIENAESGFITVTYLDNAGAFQTTSPVAVTFNKE